MNSPNATRAAAYFCRNESGFSLSSLSSVAATPAVDVVMVPSPPMLAPPLAGGASYASSNSRRNNSYFAFSTCAPISTPTPSMSPARIAVRMWRWSLTMPA